MIHSLHLRDDNLVCLVFPDEAQEAEAIQVLNAIYDMNENQDMPGEATAKISYALAMLYYTLHDIERVSNTIQNNLYNNEESVMPKVPYQK